MNPTYYHSNAAKPAVAVLTLLIALLQPGGTPSAFAAEDAASNSSPTSLKAGPVRDIESELRKRFDYPVEGRHYSANDPAYPVIYSEEQKQAQRTAAREMIAELQRAAKSADVHSFTIPKGIYRVGVEEIVLTDVRDFTIHAPGVELIVDTEKKGAAFLFVGCTNVTLTGRPAAVASKERAGGTYLTIDSEQLPMSVARILASDDFLSEVGSVQSVIESCGHCRVAPADNTEIKEFSDPPIEGFSDRPCIAGMTRFLKRSDLGLAERHDAARIIMSLEITKHWTV